MGSRRSRNEKALEHYNDHLDEIFAQIAAEREGRFKAENKPEPKKEEKERERENPNHPCYKCLTCAGWTRCPGYMQLLECIKRRKENYENRNTEQG